MKFDDEFKEAIRDLPEKEKDKLLLRLLKKDVILAKRLQFELLGNESAEDRRTEIEEEIREILGKSFRSAAYLMLEARSLSGRITEHVKITKDKIGEVSLNLLLLNTALCTNTRVIELAPPKKAHKAGIYFVAKAFKVLLLINALHEDYRGDFREDLEQLGKCLSKSDFLLRMSIRNGLDVNWLVDAAIPENIGEIHTQVRKNGFLK